MESVQAAFFKFLVIFADFKIQIVILTFDLYANPSESTPTVFSVLKRRKVILYLKHRALKLCII